MCTHAGVSVVGTRFFFDNNTKRINIKIINDNESDYLIKTDVKSNVDFVVTPPLLLIKKNQSNIVSIIPNNIKLEKDKVFDLVVTAIPKSDMSPGNKINLAIRSNFKLIYRHNPLSDKILNELVLIKDTYNKNVINNLSNSFLTIYTSCHPDINKMSNKVNIPANQKITIDRCDEVWISMVNDDGSMGSMKKLYLSK